MDKEKTKEEKDAEFDKALEDFFAALKNLSDEDLEKINKNCDEILEKEKKK